MGSLFTNSGTAKAGQTATALPGLDSVLLSSCAKPTPQYHCMYMQHVTALLTK